MGPAASSDLYFFWSNLHLSSTFEKVLQDELKGKNKLCAARLQQVLHPNRQEVPSTNRLWGSAHPKQEVQSANEQWRHTPKKMDCVVERLGDVATTLVQSLHFGTWWNDDRENGNLAMILHFKKICFHYKLQMMMMMFHIEEHLNKASSFIHYHGLLLTLQLSSSLLFISSVRLKRPRQTKTHSQEPLNTAWIHSHRKPDLFIELSAIVKGTHSRQFQLKVNTSITY